MSGLGILVGPGVVRAGAVAGLRALADATGCGVVNTWGAKGVFPWDDERHHGTAGLQARDFELAGLGDVEVLLTSGLDPAEVTSEPWAGRARVVEVPPGDLATTAVEVAAGRRRLPAGAPGRPRLYSELAAVCGPLYARPGSAPARAAALAAGLPDGGLVVAEPGLVGFWVARTFPTSVPGSVVVPAAGGAAAAWAVVRAASARRPVTLVAASPPPEGALPASVGVEVWTADEVDLDPTPLVAVAGPIVAWS